MLADDSNRTKMKGNRIVLAHSCPNKAAFLLKKKTKNKKKTIIFPNIE